MQLPVWWHDYLDKQWADDLLDTKGIPVRWRNRLLRSWGGSRALLDSSIPEVKRENAAKANANAALRERVERITSIRLPVNASDDDVCKVAEEMAETIAGLSRVFHEQKGLRKFMSEFVRRIGVEPPCDDPESSTYVKDISAIARMTCAQWWRRRLRRLHAKVVEGAAIELGYVNRTSDCYVSNESLERRIQQNKRNARMLENTLAINEHGHEYTLAELSAKGVANKQIRRDELMTRISGFEVIAKDSKHVGLFITATCPSRMHKWKTVGKGKVVQNEKYDGTQPDEAQKYLTNTFAKARAAYGRRGCKPYGFRITEPNHDGTPHWHMLVFIDEGHAEELIEILRKYFLMDSPDEAGAKEHRCKVVHIDWSRGSAAGYIAKYVAKNIDGYKVDKDLFGNDALESSVRVEAWASTWGIRQFQQIGGAPVGVWRELRRVKELPDDAPQSMVQAWVAVNRIENDDGAPAKRADWAEYQRAQGGVFKPVVDSFVIERYGKPTVRNVKKKINGVRVTVNKVVTVRKLQDRIIYKRAWPLVIEKEDAAQENRYYEDGAKIPVGVGAEARKEQLMPVLEDEVLDDEAVEAMAESGMVAPVRFKLFKWSKRILAKSVRYCWEIVRKGVGRVGVGARKAFETARNVARKTDALLADKVMTDELLNAQEEALKRLQGLFVGKGFASL